MRCGVEGSQVSDGGDSHVFTFGCRISDFFFSQCSRITNCFVTRMWSVLCFLFAVRFLEQVVLKCVFEVKLMTLLDIFQTNVFVFPLVFFSSYGYLFYLIWILYCDCFDSLSVSLFSWILSVRDMFLHATLLSCGYCVLTFDPSSWMCKLNFLYCMKLLGCGYGH